MGDVGCGCARAQVTAHMPHRRNRSSADRGNGSQKTLECGKVGKVRCNNATAYPVPTFATSSSSSSLASLNPQPHSPRPQNRNQIWEMAPKRGAAKPKKASPKKAGAIARRDEEWVPSRTGEAELNRLVEVGVLPDRATAGWRPALCESFPTPHTNEAVVFEDYFWHGLGFPVHPFLRDLLEL